MGTLSDRQKTYINVYDSSILPRLPIVVNTKIRNFPRLSKKTDKPYSIELWRILRHTMYNSILDIEGAVFSYNYESEMNFILNNNNNIYDNKIQRINSVITSLCSINFLKHFLSSDEPPDLLGEAIFETTTFLLPSLTETMNYLVWRQQIGINHSVSLLLEAQGVRIKKSIVEKKNLLYNEYGIDYEEYPNYFKYGSLCYKVPKITEDGKVKKKWYLDIECGDFLESRDFVMNILHSGQDIVRPERDI